MIVAKLCAVSISVIEEVEYTDTTETIYEAGIHEDIIDTHQENKTPEQWVAHVAAQVNETCLYSELFHGIPAMIMHDLI